jgi:hypothetical protein
MLVTLANISNIYLLSSTHGILEDVEDTRAESASDEAMWLVWVVQEAHFEGKQSFRPQVNSLLQLVRRPIPDVKKPTVMPCMYINNPIVHDAKEVCFTHPLQHLEG